jgi:hypothetical protein
MLKRFASLALLEGEVPSSTRKKKESGFTYDNPMDEAPRRRQQQQQS